MNAVLIEPPALAAPQRLPVRFTGSGSEYFRIWIVNLLLTLVTIGIYYPWAKLRRLRYFHGNTLVGDEPLAFHGNALLMLRGYAVMAVFFIGYGVIRQLSPIGGLLALIVLALIWPALWRASLQFRMANTSWRGMRFAFTGSLAAAYSAMLPAWLPALLLVGSGVMLQRKGEPPAAPGAGFGLIVLVALGFLPALWLRVKRYQHSHYAYGHETTRFNASMGSMYALWLKAFGLTVALLLVFAVIASVVVFILRQGSATGWQLSRVLPLAGLFVVYIALIVLIGSFFAARLQNLVWTATSSQRIEFDSALRARALSGLTLKIWLLMLLTLGFYWPFARVALARLRLEATTVRVDGGAAALASSGVLQQPGAAGDAAGEFFGIDLGL